MNFLFEQTESLVTEKVSKEKNNVILDIFIDNSSSMSGNSRIVREKLCKLLTTFENKVKDINIHTFDATYNNEGAKKFITNAQYSAHYPSSPIFYNVLSTINTIKDDPKNRHIVISITDGGDTTGQTGLDAAKKVKILISELEATKGYHFLYTTYNNHDCLSAAEAIGIKSGKMLKIEKAGTIDQAMETIISAVNDHLGSGNIMQDTFF